MTADKGTDPELRKAIDAIRQETDPDSERSFALLYETYFHALQRFFARKGFAPEDALDLTQESLLAVYRGVKDFRHEARFETWLFRVATTTYLKRLRTASAAKRSRLEDSDEMMQPTREPLASTEDQLENVLDDERRQALRQAIEELPEKMRKCLTLRIYNELSYREIATVTKLKINTVKVLLFRARDVLRAKMMEGASLEPEEPDIVR